MAWSSLVLCTCYGIYNEAWLAASCSQSRLKHHTLRQLFVWPSAHPDSELFRLSPAFPTLYVKCIPPRIELEPHPGDKKAWHPESSRTGTSCWSYLPSSQARARWCMPDAKPCTTPPFYTRRCVPRPMPFSPSRPEQGHCVGRNGGDHFCQGTRDTQRQPWAVPPRCGGHLCLRA